MICDHWFICTVVLDDSTWILKWPLIWDLMLCVSPIEDRPTIPRKCFPINCRYYYPAEDWAVSPRGLQMSCWLVWKHERLECFITAWLGLLLNQYHGIFCLDLFRICEVSTFQRSTFQLSENLNKTVNFMNRSKGHQKPCDSGRRGRWKILQDT